MQNQFQKFLFFFLIILSTSCKTDVKKESVEERVSREHSIINFSFYNTEYENWMSFPVWFNDSLIRVNDIVSIKRELFSEAFEDTSLYINEVLNHRWVYDFNSDGTVLRVDAASIYDAKIISEVVFNYRGFDRNTGYSQVMVSEREMADYENLPYIIHNKKSENKDWSTFTEWSNQYHIYVLNNEQHWKSLVIDTMIGPKPIDYIVLGGFIMPKKSYKVSNLVEENNVRNFTYSKQHLKLLERVEDPFINKKRFEYNPKTGLLDKIVDSTFSMGGFVSRSIIKIEYRDGLPYSISKWLQRKEEQKLMFSERFTYTFRTPKDK